MKPVLRQKRVFSTKPFLWQKRVFGRIAAWTCNNWHDPCNTIYAENHAYDHNKIVNIELNSKYFNVAESACLQCMSSASDWSNSTCQPFLTSNWHFWQMVQMSAQCLLCKTEKAQISGQMQIICTGWHLWLRLPLSMLGTREVPKERMEKLDNITELLNVFPLKMLATRKVLEERMGKLDKITESNAGISICPFPVSWGTTKN